MNRRVCLSDHMSNPMELNYERKFNSHKLEILELNMNIYIKIIS